MKTALLAVTDPLATARASSLFSVLMLLDLSAAFDMVNHQLLISILAEMGISGAALSWIASYLADRSYQVAWGASVSASHPLLTGVPQGSVLGPVLFSLYTIYLGSVIKSHGFSYHCYTDDTQLFLYFPPSATQVNEKISACLADISSWMARYHLKLNVDKTELLFIPHRTSPLPELCHRLCYNSDCLAALLETWVWSWMTSWTRASHSNVTVLQVPTVKH